jgi:hypothetical protein
MKFSKQFIVPAVALGAVISLAGISAVSADEADRGPDRMIGRFVERFGLDQDDVQSFFDEERQTRQEERQAEYEARLSDAVSAGELTEEQKRLVLAKHEEMRVQAEGERGNRGEEGREEREAHREEMDSRRAELEDWAEENGIDMKYFGSPEGFHGHGRHGGPHGGFGAGDGQES